MKMPSYEPIPAWYEISSRDSGKTLVLEVHPLALREMEKVEWNKAPILPHFKKEYGLAQFTPPQKGNCGFSDVLKVTEPVNKDWTAWKVELPVIKAAPHHQVSSEGYSIAVRATLSTFTNCLWLFEEETQCENNQLMVIEAIHLPDKERWVYGGALSVTLTPDAIKWIGKQPNEQDIGSVVEAMRNAHEHMWYASRKDWHFGAICRSPKWIHLDVPGDACGLDPESNADRHESVPRGYTLQPHNTDSALQQFTLLAGLAKLHDAMRGR